MTAAAFPMRSGPDYDGRVRIRFEEPILAEVEAMSGDGGHVVSLTLIDQRDARELFSSLGDALRVIDANADPS